MPNGFVARWSVATVMVALIACHSAPPKVLPLITRIQIAATADINPDAQGRASPVVVRIYQLRTDAEFTGAQFFQLYDHEMEALGASLISRDEYLLTPSAQMLKELPASPDVHFFGVLAAYRDSSAQWRAVVAVPPNPPKPKSKKQAPERLVDVHLSRAAVAVAINE
jgi:type VI secretion system protein VasD